MVAQTQQLAQALHDVGFDSTDLALRIRADGQHAEWFWRREFPEAYRWLLRRMPTTDPNLIMTNVRWYPNPSGGRVRLIGLDDFDEPEVRVFDAFGRLRFAGRVTYGTDLDITGWSPGVYTTSLVNHPHIRPFRLMVQ